MTPFIEEAERLLRLARRDYQTCAILGSHPEAQIAPICFHAQQCVEKSLKAAMTAITVPIDQPRGSKPGTYKPITR